MQGEDSNKAFPSNTKISIESVAALPLPGMAIPGSLAFSPDGKLITYLHSHDASLVNSLYTYDIETGEHQLLLSPPNGGISEGILSLEEKLVRERQRRRELGITQYSWSSHTNRLLIPLKGDIYIQEGLDGTLERILAGNGRPALDARFSPDGQWISFVREDELHIISSSGGKPQQLTNGAQEEGVTHGLAEYIAQEEMARKHGYWWSADSQWLAFTEVDERHIPIYRIVHQGKDMPGQEAQEDHRYPFAGQPNAKVRLGVVSIKGGEPVWMDLGVNEDFYLARVKWLPDGRLSAQRLNREQTQLDLLIFDPQTGQSTLLLEEKTDVWINLHHMFRPLKDGRFIWASERTRFQHLYLYDKDGQVIRPLTSGEWMVDAISGIDPIQQRVYFTGSKNDPRESHLYEVSFDGGEPRQITAAPGTHSVVVDIKKGRFIDVHQAIDTPPYITLCSLGEGEKICSIFEQTDSYVAGFDLRPPELVTLHSRGGDLLYGAIYRPPASFGKSPYPTIVSVYGGPHAQRVSNSWGLTVDMRAQYLCNKGFLVFKLDNRGSARRGLQFESHIKYDMGHIEVEDQKEGVKWLVGQELTDPERIGVYGWSYGGYMALMCLARAVDTFRVAVAGAPVTHWDGYDTCYTERYMGTPRSNPDGYEISSVMHHVDNIKGNLLLVHGLIDENVHFRHTARLVNSLIKSRKAYELLLFPDERHMPRSLEDRIYMEERIFDFFVRNL